MPLSAEDQALFDHVKNSLPRWLTDSPKSSTEWLYALTAVFSSVRNQGQDWLDLTYLDNAVDSELDQHAADRGTSRRFGETDAVLRERLRNITDSVTEPALISGIDAIVDSQGIKQQFRVQQYSTTGWDSVFRAINQLGTSPLTLTMISDLTNPPILTQTGNSTTIQYLAGTATRVQIENLITSQSTLFTVATASSSPATPLAAGDAFTNKPFYLSRIVNLRRDRGHFQAVGFSHAFMERGYRMASNSRLMGYVVILPFGTSAATTQSVLEYLRQNGPGGFFYLVETRATP